MFQEVKSAPDGVFWRFQKSWGILIWPAKVNCLMSRTPLRSFCAFCPPQIVQTLCARSCSLILAISVATAIHSSSDRFNSGWFIFTFLGKNKKQKIIVIAWPTSLPGSSRRDPIGCFAGHYENEYFGAMILFQATDLSSVIHVDILQLYNWCKEFAVMRLLPDYWHAVDKVSASTRQILKRANTRTDRQSALLWFYISAGKWRFLKWD